MSDIITNREIDNVLKQLDDKIQGNGGVNQFVERVLDNAKNKLLTLPI